MTGLAAGSLRLEPRDGHNLVFEELKHTGKCSLDGQLNCMNVVFPIGDERAPTKADKADWQEARICGSQYSMALAADRLNETGNVLLYIYQVIKIALKVKIGPALRYRTVSLRFSPSSSR